MTFDAPKIKKNLFENTVGEGENAGSQHFLLFPHAFPHVFFYPIDTLAKPSLIAQLVVWWTWEQEVTGSIPGSADILSEDWW